MAAEGQSDRMASDMDVHMKQKCVNEFLHAETMAPTDIYWYLLNTDGDQTVDVSTVRWWVVCFSSGDSGSPPLMQIFTGMARRLLIIMAKMHSSWWWSFGKILFHSWESALSNNAIELFVAVSMEINMRHYFQSNLLISENFNVCWHLVCFSKQQQDNLCCDNTKGSENVCNFHWKIPSLMPFPSASISDFWEKSQYKQTKKHQGVAPI